MSYIDSMTYLMGEYDNSHMPWVSKMKVYTRLMAIWVVCIGGMYE